MRCPSCGNQNPAEASQCSSCGTKLARRSRRRAVGEEVPSPSATGLTPRHHPARTAYRLSIVGLVPLVGLVLGPLSLVLGFIAWRKDRSGPEPIGPAIAAMVFGTLSLILNWAGL